MAFFVVQRDAHSALSIPLPDAYPTREAAIAALSAATSSGLLVLADEVFIADLSNAVPVLIMQAAPSPASGEALAEKPTGDFAAKVADDVYAPPLLGDEQSLAAALQRAATSLEQEGIVAPASIESEPAEATELPEPIEAEAPQAVDEEASAESAAESATWQAESEQEPFADSVVKPAGGVETGDDRPWGWANVEAYEAPETDVAEEEAVSAEVEASGGEQDRGPGTSSDEIAPAPADEGEPSATDEIAPAPADEGEPSANAGSVVAEALVDHDSPYIEAPEPGDPGEQIAGQDEASLDDELYGLIGAPGDAVTGDDSPIITSAPSDGEDVYIPRPVILGDYADEVAPVDADGQRLDAVPVEAGGLSPAVTPAFGIEPEPTVEPGYESTGDLDLGGYTCDDCVYSNTCPKVGQATPADCGSFQWRSE